jgi:UDP-N-acetylglucosamine 2-epimerase (non-hydrolysing)
VGDVTSTMACTITAKKLGISVAHVEAGIRSGDMTMPEEINRIVTDAICDHFFTTSEVANDFLQRSGVSSEKIHFVGNTMIDTLYHNEHRLMQPPLWIDYNLKEKEFFLVTLHRPSNVDDASQLKSLLDAILKHTGRLPIIFPVHPRTKKTLDMIGFHDSRLLLSEPMSYLEFIHLVKNAKGVITDSGGITEETTVLHVPCITLRNSTERPETVTMGTNELVGTDPSNLEHYLKKLMKDEWKQGTIPPLWDGKASERIASIICSMEM